MLKDKLIILLLYQPWQWSTDYQNQTVKALQKLNNKVVIYYGHKETVLWNKEGIKSLFKKKDSNFDFFIPVHFFPLRRLSFIKNINQSINLFRLNRFCKNLFKRKEEEKNILQAVFWFFEPNSLIQSLHLLNIKHQQLVFDCVDYFPSNELMLAVKKSSHIFCISKNMKQLLNQLNKDKKTIKLVPQGFDLDNFKKNKMASDNVNKKNKIGRQDIIILPPVSKIKIWFLVMFQILNI